MTLSYGFFNSIGEDRVYDATDFSTYLTGILENGCFPNDTGFKAMANPAAIGSDPPSVILSAGKAYYDGMWIYNDADLVFYMGTGQQGSPGMYHLIHFCFDTNNTSGGRKVTIECLTSTNPTLPSNGSGKYYMPLAKVTDQQSSQPLQAHILDQRLSAGVHAVDVDETSIQTAAVTGTKIATGAVTEAKIGGLAVTEGKIDTGAVTNAKIGSGAVTEAKIGTGAVTETKLGSSAVTAAKIAADAVTSAKILDGNVTNAKIADGAVGLAKLANAFVIYNSTRNSGVTLSSGGTQTATLWTFSYVPATPCTLFIQGAVTVHYSANFYADIQILKNGSQVARYAGTHPGGNPNNRIVIPFMYAVNLEGTEGTTTLLVQAYADSGTMTFNPTGYPNTCVGIVLPR